MADNNIKFFTDKTVEFSKLMENVRKVWELNPSQSLYFKVDGRILKPSRLVGDIYEHKKAEDGFLYIQVSDVDPWG